MRLALYETDVDGPTVVVAHGAGSSALFVTEAFARPLAAVGWRLVAVDLRGHGASTPVRDPGRHALAHHVADLGATCTATRARLVAGVSLGGMAAVRLAATRPEQFDAVGAVLPAWTGRATPGEGPHAAVAAAVRRDGVRRMLRDVAHDDTLQPWLREVLVRDWAAHDPASLAAALVALDGGDAPGADELQGLAVPLGVVTWPDDPGHPDAVGRAWARLAPRGAHRATSIRALEADRAVLGHALVAAWAALGPDVLSRPRGSHGSP